MKSAYKFTGISIYIKHFCRWVRNCEPMPVCVFNKRCRLAVFVCTYLEKTQKGRYRERKTRCDHTNICVGDKITIVAFSLSTGWYSSSIRVSHTHNCSIVAKALAYFTTSFDRAHTKEKLNETTTNMFLKKTTGIRNLLLLNRKKYNQHILLNSAERATLESHSVFLVVNIRICTKYMLRVCVCACVVKQNYLFYIVES